MEGTSKAISPVYDKGQIDAIHVSQKNEFIRFKKTPMTVLESKIVRYIVAQISMNDTELLTYRINATKLADALGIKRVDRPNLYREFKNLSSTLAKQTVHVETGVSKSGRQTFSDIPWFEEIGYDENDNLVIRFNKRLEQYVLYLREFTNYRLMEVLQLPSDNCIKLYELLISWQGKPSDKNSYVFYGHKLEKNEIVFSIDYLKDYFGCNEKYSSRPSDFVRRIIEPNVKTINEKIIGVKQEPLKQDNKIVAVLFTLGY